MHLYSKGLIILTMSFLVQSILKPVLKQKMATKPYQNLYKIFSHVLAVPGLQKLQAWNTIDQYKNVEN